MLSFANSPGALFNRLGKLGLLIQQARTYQTSQLANFTNTTTGAVAQYNAESDLQALLGGAYISQLNSVSVTGNLAQQVASATLNRMIFRDNPRFGQTLTNGSNVLNLQELIRQMKVMGATVLAQTITATPSAFTGTGNGAVVASVRRPLDGLVLENAFAETMLITCTADSYTGGATVGAEPFSATGTGSQPNPFAFNWPLGSNASASLQAIDAATDNGNGNLLTNGSFDTWASLVPSNWSLQVGTPGTDVSEETTLEYEGAACLKITGDGSTLTRLAQKFNSSSSTGVNAGTRGDPSALTQYAFCAFLRRDGVAAAAGVLTVELVDGNGVVIQDEAGASNTFDIDLTALTVGYVASTGTFRLPDAMPDEISIRLRLSTALTSGRSVYVDHASLGVMTQTYVSGPFLSVHSGVTPFTVGDWATVAITNSRGSGGTLSTFQTLVTQLWSEMYSNEFILPSSSTPNISDSSLIA